MKRNYIDGRWVDTDGATWISRSPADAEDVLGEFAEDVSAAEEAIGAARRAQPAWEALGLEGRRVHLMRFAEELGKRVEVITDRIAREVGKPSWEAIGEARALGSKIGQTLDHGLKVVQGELLAGSTRWVDGGYRFRALGVCAVLGPFNFPLHLANGHIIAALATGNTCVFKPSELAPSCAELFMEAVDAAELPRGVLNMVQGQRATGEALVASLGVDAVLFTGSVPTGLAIRRATVDQPWKLLALEMGGKNTSIVLSDADLDRAAYEIGTAALLTSGQRCTATSRVVVARSLYEGLEARLSKIFRDVQVGHPLDDATFMGPLINAAAVERFLQGAETAAAEGMEAVVAGAVAEVHREGRRLHGHYIRPALWRATRPPDGTGRHDAHELFASDVVLHLLDDGASDEEVGSLANATPFGLAMSVFTTSVERFERLEPHLRCGVLNFNRSTVGASGMLPFGGVKNSGNHRPAASLAPAYCTYPVSTLREQATLAAGGRMARFPEF